MNIEKENNNINQSEIIVCEYCGKVDCTQEHQNNCNYEYGAYTQDYIDNLWK